MDKGITKRKLDRWDMLFCAVLVVATIVLICIFQFKKEGWHSDEVWEYGFANSYYQPYIFRDINGNFYNNRWRDVQELKDYVVVNEGERFACDSVYYNQSKDLNPPMHAMLLHIICSFFPETFSFWYAFVINVVFFVMTLIYLYKLFTLIKNKQFALLVTLFYGISAGAVDMFLYCRMYAMETGLLLCFLYFLVKEIKSDKTSFSGKALALLFSISVIGFLTQYYFISIVGMFTFFFCAYLFFQKRMKKMFQLGFSMLFALGAAAVIYPNLFGIAMRQSDSVHNVRNAMVKNYNFEIRMKILANFMLYKQFKVSMSWYRSGILPIALGIFVFLFIVSLPLLFLIRNTAFAAKALQKIRFFTSHFTQIVKSGLKKINWICVIITLVLILQMVVVSETSNVAGMGEYEDRYIAYLYPLATGVILLLAYTLLKFLLGRIRVKGRAVYLPVFLLLAGIGFCRNVIGVSSGSYYYFTRDTETKPITELVEGGNVVYLENSPWFLTTMTPIFMTADAFFLVNGIEYFLYTDAYRSKLDEPLFLVVNTEGYSTVNMEKLTGVSDENMDAQRGEKEKERQEALDKILQYYDDLIRETEMQRIGIETVFGREMVVYRLNP